jgi:hypothetical protein
MYGTLHRPLSSFRKQGNSMSLWFMIVVACLMSVVPGGLLLAQQGPDPSCDGQCPGMPWGPEQTTVSMAISPTCNVSVTYQKRSCLGVTEVQVVRVTMLPGCNTADSALIFHQAISMVTFNNAFELPLPGTAPGINIASWRIIRPACTQPGTVAGTIVGCPGPCCVSDITVRRIGDCDTWFFAGETVRSQYVDCSEANPNQSACDYSCFGELVKKKGSSTTPQ